MNPAKPSAAQLINQDSGDVEIFTPACIVDAAFECMGEIDLDPFSCELANKTVRAVRFLTKEQDGFSQPWL